MSLIHENIALHCAGANCYMEIPVYASIYISLLMLFA